MLDSVRIDCLTVGRQSDYRLIYSSVPVCELSIFLNATSASIFTALMYRLVLTVSGRSLPQDFMRDHTGMMIPPPPTAAVIGSKFENVANISGVKLTPSGSNAAGACGK